MGFYLNYLVSNKSERSWDIGGHSSLAVTWFDPLDQTQNKPITLFRIGLNNNSTAVIEHNSPLIIKRGRKYQHKTFPLAQEELTALLIAINTSRRLEATTSDARIDIYDYDPRIKIKMRSKPGGPIFNTFRYNCKTYTQTIMNAAGIDEPSLRNWFIDIPTLSGTLSRVNWKAERNETGYVLWESPMLISERDNFKNFTAEERENFGWEKLFVDTTIHFNRYKEQLLIEASAELDIKNQNDTGARLEAIHVLKDADHHSSSLKLIAAKYHHAKRLKNILEDPTCGKTLKERFQTIKNELDLPEVQKDLDTNRGFWAWLRNTLGLRSSGTKLSFFVKKSMLEIEQTQQNIQSSPHHT